MNVTLFPFDQYQQKMALLMASGTPPDVFRLPPGVMRYVAEGKVIPLDA